MKTEFYIHGAPLDGNDDESRAHSLTIIRVGVPLRRGPNVHAKQCRDVAEWLRKHMAAESFHAMLSELQAAEGAKSIGVER